MAGYARAGADVLYILTGERSATALTVDERLVLEGYRRLNAQGKQGVLALIAGLDAPPAPTQVQHSQVIYGNATGNVIAGRDVVHEPAPKGRGRKT